MINWAIIYMEHNVIGYVSWFVGDNMWNEYTIAYNV